MKCTCGAEMKSKKENYRYTESGLPNVTLVGVEVRRCPECGEWEVAIPRLAELHRAIARWLARKKAPLKAQEFRFLRQYLGYSGSDFANAIGVTAATVSRWENGKLPLSRETELLVRYMALNNEPLTEYPPVESRDMRELPKRIDPKAPTPNVFVRQVRNHWKGQPEARV